MVGFISYLSPSWLCAFYFAPAISNRAVFPTRRQRLQTNPRAARPLLQLATVLAENQVVTLSPTVTNIIDNHMPPWFAFVTRPEYLADPKVFAVRLCCHHPYLNFP
jgi:hypothetical protein